MRTNRASAFLSTILLISAAHSAFAQALVLEGGTLIDGTGKGPVENAVVVMEGSRIKAVGVKGKISYPSDARVIKENGKFILPGLIDALIHYRGWDPQMFLHYGVTTVIDPSNPGDWIVAQRDMINHGKIKGPRMFVCGNPITGPKEFSRMNSGAEQNGGLIRVLTVEEARRAVATNAAAGVDLIQVEESLTPELLNAVIAEAAKHHLPVVGHSRDARASAEAGFKYVLHSVPIAHAVFEAEDSKKLAGVDWINVEFPGIEGQMNPQFYDPLIKLMVGKGVAFDPTFGLEWRAVNPRSAEWAGVAAEMAKEPGIEFVPADVRRNWMEPPRRPVLPVEQLAAGLKRVGDFTREFSKAGGKLVAGSDSMGGQSLQGVAISFELESMVDAGVPPMQALLAATKYPAELVGKQKLLGTVESGKFADLLVVDEDPLKDIAAIRKIALIVKEGQIVDRSYDPKFVNPIPRTGLNGQLKGPDNGASLETLKPSLVAEGSRDATIQLTGERFTDKSVVRFNGADLHTKFVSSSQLAAVIPAASLKNVGSYAVTVFNTDSGVNSNLRYLIVNFKY